MIELIRLLLCYKFYDDHKHKILKEMLPKNLYDLYDLVVESHNRLKQDLTVDEVKALYRTAYPTTTRAKLDVIYQVLDTLPEVSFNVAQEVLEKAWITEIGRQITQAGCDIVNGKETSFEKAKSLIGKIEQGELVTRDELTEIGSELEDVLDAISITTKYPFNLTPLAVVCSGVGPGIFTIIGGRTEAGKSALGISLVAAPNGFADQGALVHYYANEEAGVRLQGRAFMSYTGMPLIELTLHKEEARKTYSKIKDNLKFFDCRDKDIAQVNAHILKYKPDVAVFDQADKLNIRGTFAREDERLGGLYSEIRNIGERQGIATFAITQLSANSEGKLYVSSADLSNARTAKAAEGDIVLGIGKSPKHDDQVRLINVIKNKVLGLHNEVITILHPEISRYTE